MKSFFIYTGIVLFFISFNSKLFSQSDYSIKSKGYAPVNGINMYYEIHGEGQPLVLIHGGGSTIQTTFGQIIPLLAKHNKIIAVELQAHGHTSDRNVPETFQQDADDVATLLHYLNINKASFFGFSNGGNTSMQIAIRHPEIVEKLVIASSFYKRDGMIKGFFEGLQSATLQSMPEHLRDEFLKIKNDSAALQRMFEMDRNRMIQFKDWSDEDLGNINAPALIIAGDRDVVTTEHSVLMSQKIMNSRLMILPANHGSYLGEIMSQNDADETAHTASIIHSFLEKQL